MEPTVEQEGIEESPWSEPPGDSVLFLQDADNDVECELLDAWIESSRAASGAADTKCEKIVLPILHGRKGRIDIGDLPAKLAMPDATQIVPLRVVWMPPKSRRKSGPRLRDLFFGDPRHPRGVVARQIMRISPERARKLRGTPATIGQLREQFAKLRPADDADTIENFAAFVVSRAGVALDVAERRLQGNRYKIPRFVAHSLRSSPKFNKAMQELATELGRPVGDLHKEARGYMKEMIAVPNSFFIDWMGKIMRFIVSRGYEDQLVYDEADLERTRQILRQYPSALLWTHKSHIDGMAVIRMLYENDLPAPHSLGGINMAFGLLGTLGRKSGIIFIRRTFADNPVYKLVFRHYLGYLMEKRFPFSWAFEGTRSRVGKLMPPRYGLIKYVLEAAHATHASDLHFIPVSISYDLIGEVAEYAREQSGHAKRPESLKWFLGYVSKMRAPKGRIYFDFGEPVVIEGVTPDPDQVDIPKTAFEVAVRVNNMTPVTFPSLACMVLLGAAPRALTIEEISSDIRELVRWARKRRIRLADHFGRGRQKQLEELAQFVIDRGIASKYDQGSETVYSISDDQIAVAGYYRNTVVHYFVNKAIIELALAGVAGSDAAGRVDAFWEETDRLRDLFKFEFFYSPKQEFRQQIEDELAMFSDDWKNLLLGDAAAVNGFLASMRPLVAHATLLPYVESYGIVAEVLQRLESDAGINEKECIETSLKFGQQRYLQRRVSSKASIAKLLFSNGFKLFEHRGLTKAGVAKNGELRDEASRDFAELSSRIEHIGRLAQAPQGQ